MTCYCSLYVDADAQKHVKEVYATHVRRLMYILDQEQQARLRVEDKLDDMKVIFDYKNGFTSFLVQTLVIVFCTQLFVFIFIL